MARGTVRRLVGEPEEEMDGLEQATAKEIVKGGWILDTL